MITSYITSAAQADQLPQWEDDEICFVGRSNAGKSSLLNALTGHKGLARASATPGRTQMVNFFAWGHGQKKVVLADLPGYGYTASGGAKSKHWDRLVTAYLRRPQIRHAFFLMDIRRTPDDMDLEILHSLAEKTAGHVTIALTKSDKVNQSQRAQTVLSVKKTLEDLWGYPVNEPSPWQVVAVSSLKKTGMNHLQSMVQSYLSSSPLS